MVRYFVVRVVIDADVLQKVIQRQHVFPLTSIWFPASSIGFPMGCFCFAMCSYILFCITIVFQFLRLVGIFIWYSLDNVFLWLSCLFLWFSYQWLLDPHWMRCSDLLQHWHALTNQSVGKHVIQWQYQIVNQFIVPILFGGFRVLSWGRVSDKTVRYFLSA